ncbi:hypothetical protein DFJ74DRAFT_405805 [Hyaloraphidium curvatum]|nr:hypothetical protein DFJ74DRAFT_405805 [Hyaloraphidium curvatum]
MSYFLGRDAFADLVERATSEAIPAGSDDIMVNLEVADKIKGKEVAPDKAMRTIKARLDHKNPNVQLLALKLCDICVKNGGNHFLQQISSREFLDHLETMLKQHTLNFDVRNKALALIQSWAMAFRGKPDLYYVVEVYNRLRNLGMQFPPLDKTDSLSVMVDTATAPEWTDSDVCERCRVAFTFTNRKHHCRNCGKTFCGSCSGKNEPLPHFGITKPVRVCEGCFTKLQSGSGAAAATATASMPPPMPSTGFPGVIGATDPKVAAYQSAAQSAIARMANKEDDDLAKAIALSLEEVSKPSPRPNGYSVPPSRSKEDEDLERAIAESLKDLENKRDSATQNVEAVLKAAPVASIAAGEPARDPNELNPTEAENIRLFAQLVERLEQEAASRGASAAVADASVQALYNQIAALQPKLVRNVEESVQKYRAFVDINSRIEGAMRTYDMMLQARLREAAYGTSGSGNIAAYGREPYAGAQYATSAPSSAYSYPQAAATPPAQYGYPQSMPYPGPEASAAPAPSPAVQHLPGPEAYPAAPAAFPSSVGPPQGAYPTAGPPPEQYPTAPAQTAPPYASQDYPTPPSGQTAPSYTGQDYANPPPGQIPGAVPYGQPQYPQQQAPPPQPLPVAVEEKPLIEF